MTSKSDYTPEEQQKFRKRKDYFEIELANGTAYTTEKAALFGNGLDMFTDFFKLLDVPHAVLQLGKLCEGNECVFGLRVNVNMSSWYWEILVPNVKFSSCSM